ncbi:uncharacterized protein [Watersipora subatra]|uniref:uncharacterized protein n=1 Tax=Watersipora subatra TaxID=2589382 RepID=UPI00355BDC5A
MLNAASKLITSTACQAATCEALLSWADVLVADILVDRKLFELDDAAKQLQYCSRELYSCVKLMHISADLVTRGEADGDTTVELLKTVAERIRALRYKESGCDAKPFQDIAYNVGRIVCWLSSMEKDGAVTAVVEEMTTAVMTVLIRVNSYEPLVTLRKQLCDLLVRQSTYNRALDTFALFHDSPEGHWDGLIADWCKVHRKACAASTGSAVSSRVLGAEVFGKLANKDHVISLIFKEFAEFNMKECFYEHLNALLVEMKMRAVSHVHTALHYLCVTELHITLDKNVALAQQSIDKGLELLKGCASAYSNDLTAQFYTWKYMLSYRERCSMSNVNDALSLTGVEAPVNTVKSQRAAEEPLDTAIMLWSQADPGSLYNEAKTAQCLDAISNTFYMSKNVDEQAVDSLYLSLKTSHSCT